MEITFVMLSGSSGDFSDDGSSRDNVSDDTGDGGDYGSVTRVGFCQ